MARIRRSVTYEIFFLAVSLSIGILLFYFILIKSKHYLLIKNLSPSITYVQITEKPNSSESSSPNYLAFDKNIQLPDSIDKSNYLPLERTYFTTDSLSEKPIILQDVDANILQSIADIEFKKLILRLMINEYGDVEKVIIEESKLSNELLSLLEFSFMKIKFTPGRIHGIAVPSTMRIEVVLD